MVLDNFNFRNWVICFEFLGLKMDNKLKSFIEIIIVIILFVFFSWLVQSNLGFFKNLLEGNFSGMLIYVFVVIVSIVIAPISTIPLLPIASNLWGVFAAATLSIFGWTIGAFIVFIISRKYGVPLVRKFVSLKNIYRIENKIPKENVFWTVVFLRMVIPVDILSYTLGLFSKIDLKTYMLATFIGIIPLAFVFAYVGKMPFIYQVIVFLITGIIILSGLIIKNRKNL